MYSRLDWVTWTSQQKLPQLPGRHKTSQSVPWRKEKAPQRKLIQALSLKTNGDESEVEQKESAKPNCESLQVKKFH